MTDLDKIRSALDWATHAAYERLPRDFEQFGEPAFLVEAKAALDRLAARIDGNERRTRWRHKIRGTEYEEIDEAQLQTAKYVGDDTCLVLYRGEDGQLWARPIAEFHDGRFERVIPLPPPPEAAHD